jgi:hypothetical protein
LLSKGSDSKEVSGNSKAEDKQPQIEKQDNNVIFHLFTNAGCLMLLFYFK